MAPGEGRRNILLRTLRERSSGGHKHDCKYSHLHVVASVLVK